MKQITKDIKERWPLLVLAILFVVAWVLINI